MENMPDHYKKIVDAMSIYWVLEGVKCSIKTFEQVLCIVGYESSWSLRHDPRVVVRFSAFELSSWEPDCSRALKGDRY